MNELRNKAMEKYNKFPIEYWVLSACVAFFVSSVIALTIFVNWLTSLFICFLVIPFLFAAQVASVSFKYENKLTLRSFISYFTLYFKTIFNGPYSVISNALKSILLEIVASLALFGLGVGLSYALFPGQIEYAISIYQEIIHDFSVYQEMTIQEIFGPSYEAIRFISYLGGVGGSLIGSGIFIFLTSRSSLVTYGNMTIKGAHPKMVKIAFNQLIKEHIGITKDYFSLNFPILIIYIICAGGFFALGLIFIEEISYMIIPVLAVATFFLLMIFFYPFYFPNMEAIFNKYQARLVDKINAISAYYMGMMNHSPRNDENKEE